MRNASTTNFTLLGARSAEGVFQLDANKELDVDFYYGSFTKLLSGKQTNSDACVFALHYRDGRGTLKTDNRPEDARKADGENIRLTMIGGHWVSEINAGRGIFDLLLWGGGQFGGWGKLSHRAAAVAIEGGYQFPVGFRPWLRVGYFRSTGDDDPNDGRHNTFIDFLSQWGGRWPRAGVRLS